MIQLPVMAGMPKRGSCEDVAEKERGVPEGFGRCFSTSCLMLVVTSWHKLLRASLTICLTDVSETDSDEGSAAVCADT